MISANFDRPITFGHAGSANGMDCVGIDFSDTNDRSWTTAPLVEMDIRLPAAREDVTLLIDAVAFALAENKPQKIHAYFGGSFIAFWLLRGGGTMSARIPRPLLNGRAARLSLAITTAISPHDQDHGDDQRQLGLLLHRMTFKVGQ